MNSKAFRNLFCNPQKSFHTSPEYSDLNNRGCQSFFKLNNSISKKNFVIYLGKSQWKWANPVYMWDACGVLVMLHDYTQEVVVIQREQESNVFTTSFIEDLIITDFVKEKIF